ncbi:MAG: glutathione S-transferase family protein [Pseudomonadota bacterium]
MRAPILYTNPRSRGMTAHFMLEELGIAYETRILGFEGDLQTPEYRAINPMGKLPALVHGDQTITETAAICAYLADAFPDAGLGPEPQERGAYYRWLFFGAGCLEPMIFNKMLGVEPTTEQVAQVGYGNEQRVVDTLEHALTGTDYLCGPRFTAADVYVGMSVAWVLQFKMLEPRRAFIAYLKRVSSRPAFQKVMAPLQDGSGS